MSTVGVDKTFDVWRFAFDVKYRYHNFHRIQFEGYLRKSEFLNLLFLCINTTVSGAGNPEHFDSHNGQIKPKRHKVYSTKIIWT